MGNDPPFERTTCACAVDVANCRRQPGYMIPRDFQRIADRLGISVGELGTRYLWASPGIMIGDDKGRTTMIGTVTPRMIAGSCVFLSARGRCLIHDVAPFGCAYFDMHMGPEEQRPRVNWGIAEVLSTVLYRVMWRAMRAATSWQGQPIVQGWREREAGKR